MFATGFEPGTLRIPLSHRATHTTDSSINDGLALTATSAHLFTDIDTRDRPTERPTEAAFSAELQPNEAGIRFIDRIGMKNRVDV